MGEANRSDNKSNSKNTNNTLNKSRTKCNERVEMGRNQLSPTIVTTEKSTATTIDIGFSNGGQQLKQNNSNDNVSKSKRKVKSKTLDCENADKNSAAAVVDPSGRITANVCVMQLDDMKLQAGEDELNSSASMETLSDNVSILVDGEKHWISGVDANTTCSDLVSALLSYLNEKQQQRQLQTNTDTTERWSDIKQSVYYNPSSDNNSHIQSSSNNNNNININCDSKISKVHNNNGMRTSTNPAVCYNAINQSPTNSNEPYSSNTNNTNNNMTTSALEYAIVKQYSDCEEYLDSNTKVFDVLPAKEHQARKQCALLLRRLAVAKMSAWLSSMDKDSGMGSPVGSARSAKFRRRKHKSTSSSSWLAQGNTMHPRLVQNKIQYEQQQQQQQQILTTSLKETTEGEECANARLLKIIMAQDETIHRQLALLKEKERQITKIEEEKHRKRERELGKNYLLETYLNCLEEAEAQPEFAPGVEILIDEPYNAEEECEQEEHCAAYNASNLKSATIQNEQPQHIMEDENVKLKAKQGKRQPAHKSAVASRSSAEGSIANAVDEAAIKEIELQIMWWEKVFNINCQLQCEEELLLRLHAKIRKQHAKQSYQNQREVLLQIEALDARLAQQCHHLEQGELELSDFNEQLAVKLHLLDTLDAQLQHVHSSLSPKATTNTITTITADNNACDNAYDKTPTATTITTGEVPGNTAPNHNQWPQEIHHKQQQQPTTTTTIASPTETFSNVTKESTAFTMELKEPRAIGLIMDYTQIKQQQAILSADQPAAVTTSTTTTTSSTINGACNLNTSVTENSAYNIDMKSAKLNVQQENKNLYAIDNMDLNNKYTAKDLINFQGAIAKATAIEPTTTETETTTKLTNYAANIELFNTTMQEQQQETMRNHCGNQINQQQQQSLLQSVGTVVVHRNQETSRIAEEQQPQQQQQQLIRTEVGVLDKNLLVPLHAVNGKLLQKQMFGTSKIYNSNAFMSMQQSNSNQTTSSTNTTTTTTILPAIINYQSNNNNNNNNKHENSNIKCISNNNINEEFHIANMMSTKAVDLNAVDITQLGTLV